MRRTASIVLNLIVVTASIGLCQAIKPAVPGGTVEITNSTGEIVKGTLSRIEPDGLIVTTEDGIRRIPFATLPDELKQAYGYSAEAEAELRKKRREQQAEAALKLQQSVLHQKQQIAEIEYRESFEEFRKTGIAVALKVLQVTKDGCLCSRNARVEKVVAVSEADPTDLLKLKKRTVNKQVSEPVEFSNDIFVFGIGKGIADGQRWRGTIWKCGTYSFTTVLGAQRTVQAFAPDPELALAYASKQNQ